MNFSAIKSITIPEGNATKITSNGVVLWSAKPKYTNLVPTALFTDGTIFDGIGYRRGVSWNGSNITDRNTAFTAIGLIPIIGTVVHDIYVYGLNFSGTTYNRLGLFGNDLRSIDAEAYLKDGHSGTYVSSVEKLADNYFKITTKAYSSKVKYFTICGVTISGVEPIVTIDEPIF